MYHGIIMTETDGWNTPWLILPQFIKLATTTAIDGTTKMQFNTRIRVSILFDFSFNKEKKSFSWMFLFIYKNNFVYN